MPSRRVVIIGGGVIGSSIAYHLRQRDETSDVIVIERDPTYARASSRLAMGGIRQQFSSTANIQLAQHSVRFYRQFDAMFGRLGSDRANFRQRGYLFLVNDEQAERFERRLKRQQDLGAYVARLEVDQIRRLVPDVVLDDIQFGVFGPQDGYASPRAILSTFRHAATDAGARYIADTVTGVDRSGEGLRAVVLKSGTRISTDTIVAATGAYSATIGQLVGIDIPIQPVRQQLFRCRLPRVWPYRFPVVVDPNGVHWRHEDPEEPGDDDRLVIARTNPDEVPGESFSCDMARWGPDFHDPVVRRVPALDGMELLEGWAGLYEMTADHNPLIGEDPTLRGFFVAAGFSGHGVMMAPGVGHAMSELILTGRSTSIDISPFDMTRFARGEPFWDDAMI